VEEELLADKRPLSAYTEQFEWDSAKYNVKLSIRDLAQGISKVRVGAPHLLHPAIIISVTLPVPACFPRQHVSGIEHDMKSRVTSYSKTKQNLQAIDRKTKWVPQDTPTRLFRAVKSTHCLSQRASARLQWKPAHPQLGRRCQAGTRRPRFGISHHPSCRCAKVGFKPFSPSLSRFVFPRHTKDRHKRP
jgi:hypothetical protein